MTYDCRSSGIKGKAWEHEVPPLARGSRSSSGDSAVRHPDEIKVCRSCVVASRCPSALDGCCLSSNRSGGLVEHQCAEVSVVLSAVDSC